MGAGIVLSCPCGEVYELRPEFAGRLLECPVCARRLRAGADPAAPRRPLPGLDPAFDRDVFLLRQRFFSVRAKYEVWAEDGTPVLFVERPTYPVRTFLAYVLGLFTASLAAGWVTAVAVRSGEVAGGLVALIGYPLALALWPVVAMSARPRRHVTVWRDESRGETLLRVLQDQRVAVLARSYTVLDAGGAVLARFRKYYVHNIIRRRWYVETPDGRPVAMAIEDSVVLSLLRRVLGSLFGLLRTNFLLVHLRMPAEGVAFGEFNRKFTLLDRYVLDLRGDPTGEIDRRVALALGVMLDTGERR